MIMCNEFKKIFEEGRAEVRAEIISKLSIKDFSNEMIQDIFKDLTDTELEYIRNKRQQ